jgi:hypothetical protein
VSENGSVLRCVNHPQLRWFNTKPGGKLVFEGELLADGRIKPAHPIAPIPPVKVLRARLNGKNPYDERLDEPAATEWQDVLDFVKWVEHNEERYAFECACPGSLLERVPDETTHELVSREGTI